MTDLRKSWDIIAKHYAKRYDISTDVVHYGPLCPGEDKLGLLGDIRGKRVLDLGCGCGQNAVALSKMGASVTGIDFSKGQLEQARLIAKKEKATIDFLCADVSDISILPSAYFDLVLSACTLAFVKNVDQVFAGAYRVLGAPGLFVFSEMNPLQFMLDRAGKGVKFTSKYPYQPILLRWHWQFEQLSEAPSFQHYSRSISFYHNRLIAAGFRVFRILEPRPTLRGPHRGFTREIWKEQRHVAEHLPITLIMLCNKGS